MVLEKHPVPAFECIPSNCTAVQIHYVVSYQFMKNITVYDSLPYIGRLEQVMPQLKMLTSLLQKIQILKFPTVHPNIKVILYCVESKKISNDQELIQSDHTSCPQNQKGNN